MEGSFGSKCGISLRLKQYEWVRSHVVLNARSRLRGLSGFRGCYNPTFSVLPTTLLLRFRLLASSYYVDRQNYAKHILDSLREDPSPEPQTSKTAREYSSWLRPSSSTSLFITFHVGRIVALPGKVVGWSIWISSTTLKACLICCSSRSLSQKHGTKNTYCVHQ